MDAKYRAKGYESYRFSHGKNRFYDLILRQIGKNVLIQVKLIHLDTYIWNFHLDPVGSLPVAVGTVPVGTLLRNAAGFLC